MAAKKQKKNNGINLLKGITGSKLAKLIAVLFILVAIPITVLMSQSQQNTKQEAAVASGGCYTVSSCTSCSGVYRCITTSSGTRLCCPKCVLPVFNTSGSLIRHAGICVQGTSYADTSAKCANSYRGSLVASQCPGNNFNICCIPYSIPGGTQQGTSCYKPGVTGYTDNACQFITSPCKGTYSSGLCKGPTSYQCCNKVYSDYAK
jgi:hypothetical protein